MGPAKRGISALSVAAFIVAGCDTPRRARTTLIGSTMLELTMCVGKPTSTQSLGPREVLWFYTYEPGEAGLKVTVPLIGDVSFSGKHSCTAIFRMIDGKVGELRYVGDTDDSYFTRDGVCEPIVDHCVEEPEHIPLHPK